MREVPQSQMESPAFGERAASPPAGQRPRGAAGVATAPLGHPMIPSIAGQTEDAGAPDEDIAPVAGQRTDAASRAESASNENVTRATTEAPRSQETRWERLGFMAAMTSGSSTDLRPGRMCPGLDAAEALLGPSFPVQYRG